MIRPIDMQIMVKNVDEIAKINKAHEQNLVGQQVNAHHEMNKEIKNENETIMQNRETEKKGIDKNNQGKKNNNMMNKNKKEKNEDEEKEEKRAQEPDKGRRIDLEI